ncbi:glycosyltransferase family 2 protein [Archangium sp.]|uniref:glycosyltransferase n=1 Tax=Archangium sp. TaxID=1872627 RepID=UPI002D5E9753|nr:glycosyltransferase family 2 protein [Archangium sp.]HYO59607.1 glycosyltransferase family 2 protein [Archangium sp.]
MSILVGTFAVVVGLSCAYWLLGTWGLVKLEQGLPRLGAPGIPEPTRWPRVSLVIPACNEADTLEAAVASRLAQDYPELEVVLVDDRSTDGTSALVDRLAAADARVKALHITHLPEGWLGKLHALHRGAEAATGDWLLFTDADVHFAPDTVRRAMALCEARSWDFLTVLFRLRPTSFLLDTAVSTTMRLIGTAARLHRVADPGSSASMGAGVFNLVRRDMLARTRGFEWLKLEIADDAAFGQMVKRAGGRCGVAHALGHVSVELYPSVGAMARGCEKSGFGVMGQFSNTRLVLSCLLFLLFETAPLLALAAGWPSWLRVLGVLGTGMALATCALASHVLRRPLVATLAFPVGTLLFVTILLRSGWLGWWRGGIVWRGTLYPTRMLRAGIRFESPF